VSTLSIPGNISIRPTRFARGFIVVFFVLIVVPLALTSSAGATAGLIFTGVYVVCTTWVLWINAGCDADRVWVGWGSVPRSTVSAFELTSGLGRSGAQIGQLKLYDSHGLMVLRIPRLFFSDGDMHRLIEALALPRIRHTAAPLVSRPRL